MDGRKVGEHNCSRHAFNFFPSRGIGLRNALPLRLEESVKNKGAWKRGKDKGRDKDEGGREKLEAGPWKHVRRCKLQVYRGKAWRRRRWSVVRAGRAGPTPILIKRSHKRLTNWLYVRRFIGVPEQDVKMFQS